MILSGASIDDVFVIVAFTSFTALSLSGNMNVLSFIGIPISILLGILLGVLTGLLLLSFFKYFQVINPIKVLLFLSLSFLLLEIEQQLAGTVSISGLLAIMAMGITFNQKNSEVATQLSNSFDQLWIPAEVILFVLVGTSLDISYTLQAGFATVALVILAVLVRMFGVFLSTAGTILTTKEKLFTMGAYTPKATVQAAIGGVPLAMGLPFGKEILTVSIVAILITAPIGAFFIENSYRKLLEKD
ncbi:cation:proton antiporter [Jeotgalibaca sp. MA1X17-3]|uniref:cation:proton antiporter domain-containing protein n=1 Tax=Jeotgalibaca sp. MA1X17-3 TaxID=2908211 RepID=UPI0021054932|nr:cation:proton antiporter [Jeotgalibaca sp. MA1X17-3]